MEVKIISKREELPAYETAGSAGMDLRAYLSQPVTLLPGERQLVPTGICVEIPFGFEGQIRARSGLAANWGIGLVNGVGTIDSDYRGEIKVPLINWGQATYVVRDGDRIAQLVISRYETIRWDRAESLDPSDRGPGGFGHTG